MKVKHNTANDQLFIDTDDNVLINEDGDDGVTDPEMSLIDGDGGRNLSLTQRNRTGLTNEIAKSYEAQQP